MTEEDMLVMWQLITNVGRSAMLIPLDKLEELAAENSKAHTLGPLLDPTMYHRNMDKAANATELLRSFIVFRKAIEAIRQREK